MCFQTVQFWKRALACWRQLRSIFGYTHNPIRIKPNGDTSTVVLRTRGEPNGDRSNVTTNRQFVRKHDAKFFCEYRVESIASSSWAAVFCPRLIERVTTFPAMVGHFVCTPVRCRPRLLVKSRVRPHSSDERIIEQNSRRSKESKAILTGAALCRS